MKTLTKNIVWAVGAFLIMAFIFSLFYTAGKEPKILSIDQLVAQINSGQVEKISVNGNDLNIELKGGAKAVSKKENESGLTETLKNYGVDMLALQKVNFEIKEESGLRFWAGVIIPSLLPLLIIGVFFWLMFRQARTGMSQAFTFGKANARLFAQFKDRITFNDVAGLKEAKQELVEVVDFLKNPKKYLDIGARIPRGVLLLGSPGTGKCIVGDSLVLTNKGIIEIKDIPKYFWVDSKTHRVEGSYLPTLDLSRGRDVTNRALYWYDLGEQPTRRITLRQGVELEGTLEHPIVVMNEKGELGFRTLLNLKEGDLVAIKFNTQTFGVSNEVESQQAYLMGLITGDGNMSVSSRVELTTADREIANSFREYMGDHYPTTKIGLKNDGITHVATSWALKKDFYEAGMSYLLSYDKSIPPQILQAPKDVVIAFLQGLFDTDGYFERYSVGYATVSKKLSNQIVMLLLNLGIVPRRRLKAKAGTPGHHRDVYEIMISGTALEVFSREISFRLPRKKNQLQEYLATHPKRNTNIDIFHNISHIIEKSWRDLSERGKSNNHLAKLADKVRRRGRISRQSLQKFTQALNHNQSLFSGSQYLNLLLRSNLFFSPVERIEESSARVYDFTVPKYHSFIANGIISHNTLLARAVAGEGNVPFFHISGSEFVELFVGIGSSRVRDLFSTAKKAAPCIIFIDEVDAIGRERGAGIGGGHDEREQTLNQILVEMDGFERDTKIIVVAATNRPDILDPALLRPGRFDRRVILDMPDINDREEVLKIHSRGKILAKDINLRKVAERTPGFSGADLANLMNEAAIFAARKNQKEIHQQDIFDSIEKVLLGPERRSRLLTVKEKEITAYHEAGHALVASSIKNADPVHKVSIVARGRAGGYTLKLPIEETHLRTKSQFLGDLAVLLGGYISEQLTFGDISTGASNDLQVASDLARKLVTKFGMSEKLGPITYGKTEELVFLGREIAMEKNYSEKIAAEIDSEVGLFIGRARETAQKIISGRNKVLKAIAQKLIEKETLEQEEFYSIVKGFKLKPVSV